MPPIDVTNMTAHVILDRMNRINFIEKTIGFGTAKYTCDDDRSNDTVKTLTSTGVIVVRQKNTNTIITAYVASVGQAFRLFNRATGKTKMPMRFWDIINYNNNTPYWQELQAAN